MNEELSALIRRIVAEEMALHPRRALVKLRGRTDAIADAVLARARQSPDWLESTV